MRCQWRPGTHRGEHRGGRVRARITNLRGTRPDVHHDGPQVHVAYVVRHCGSRGRPSEQDARRGRCVARGVSVACVVLATSGWGGADGHCHKGRHWLLGAWPQVLQGARGRRGDTWLQLCACWRWRWCCVSPLQPVKSSPIGTRCLESHSVQPDFRRIDNEALTGNATAMAARTPAQTYSSPAHAHTSCASSAARNGRVRHAMDAWRTRTLFVMRAPASSAASANG